MLSPPTLFALLRLPPNNGLLSSSPRAPFLSPPPNPVHPVSTLWKLRGLAGGGGSSP